MTTTTLERKRTTVDVINGGANRGARQNLPYMRRFNDSSELYQLVPTYVDPIPGRAQTLVTEAGASGVPANWREGTIESVLPQLPADSQAPLVLNIDRPAMVARSLQSAATRRMPVLVYMLVRTPRADLYGIRVVAAADDDDVKQATGAFFQALGNVTARRGSEFVLGERGRPEHLAAEPLYREWFGRHMEMNLPKVLAGLEPDSAPVELTPDGKATMPMLIRDNTSGWGDPAELAREVADNPLVPLLRGEDFAIGEIGPDGIRIHEARLRKVDGQVMIRRTGAVDPKAIEAAEAAEKERLKRAAEEAVRRAQLQSFSRSQPVLTTD